MTEVPSTRLGTIRVGNDLVTVAEIAESIATFGDRYLRRVFTPAEIVACTGADGPSAERFATRFAAKEAAVKLLRPSGAVSFHDVEVRHDAWGNAELLLHGALERHAAAIGVVDTSLTLSHDRHRATATLVATVRPAAYA